MRPSDDLDSDAVRRWIDVCVRDLRALRAEIDGINVYPVADSDTGSNLLHTITAAREALEGTAVPGAGEALAVAAEAAVHAAAGGEDDEFAGVGRNSLCPCGSGQKFKRCHGAPGGASGHTTRAGG